MRWRQQLFVFSPKICLQLLMKSVILMMIVVLALTSNLIAQKSNVNIQSLRVYLLPNRSPIYAQRERITPAN